MQLYRWTANSFSQGAVGLSRVQASDMADQIKRLEKGVVAVVYDDAGEWKYSRPWSVTSPING